MRPEPVSEEDILTGTTRRYREAIGEALTEHAEAVQAGREAVSLLRAGDDAAALEHAEEVFGDEAAVQIRDSLRRGDETSLSQAFYAPVVARLIESHRKVFEDSLGETLEELVVGAGVAAHRAGLSVELISRLDGLCMAELKALVDHQTWSALYRWAWSEYGASSPAVVELRKREG